jgi:hypothetical protein
MMMKLFVALGLLSIIQSAWSFPVSLADLNDNLARCGVEWTDESFACIQGMIPANLEGIKLEDVVGTLQICSVSWDENSAKCLARWLPNIPIPT